MVIFAPLGDNENDVELFPFLISATVSESSVSKSATFFVRAIFNGDPGNSYSRLCGSYTTRISELSGNSRLKEYVTVSVPLERTYI